jgi:hypothetical protein
MQQASKGLSPRTLLPRSTKQGGETHSVRLRIGYALLALLLAGMIAFAAPAASQPAGGRPGQPVSSQAAMAKPGTGNFVQRFMRELRSSGMEVTVGYPKLYTQADCDYSYPVFHNCFGNNPAAPYILPVVKYWPEEYVDPAMENGWGRTRPGYSATYRLDPTEAIIIFGRMPPPARYLGLQTWIWTTGSLPDGSLWNQDVYTAIEPIAGPLIQYLFATAPPLDTVPDGYPVRVQSFSSINNNINNVVMAEASGPPWDQIRYFVITPDQLTDQAVREVLDSLGVDDTEVFTGKIPPSFEGDVFLPDEQVAELPPLGLGKDNIDFFTALRYSMPEDERAANTWRKSLPLTVLRVRRPLSAPGPVLFEPHEADERQPTVNEVDDLELSAEFSDLVDAVITRAESQGLALDKNEELIEILTELRQFGPACRKIGMNCLGDNQDAGYFLMRPEPLDEGNVYAVVGTLATETGNATYVGLSVNDASLLKGVLNIPDTRLKGSADSYDYVVEAEKLEKFFIHFFARDCEAIAHVTDGACTTITADMVPLAGDDKALGDPELHGKFSAAVRAYVAVGSERGPDPRLQLRPRILSFSYR